MDSVRQNKVARLIQKELSEYFQRNATLFQGKLISVTHVRVTPDLAESRVHVSIFPADKKTEILEQINEISKRIKHEIGQKLKDALRKIPDLIFYLDDSLDYIEKIDNLLKK